MTAFTLPRKAWKTLLGGACAFVILFGVTLLVSTKVAVMGVQDATVENIVHQKFAEFVTRILAALFGVHAALGLWFAIPAAFSSKRGSFFMGLLSSASAALAFFAFGAGYRPALYSAWLYDRGGSMAAFQKFLAVNPYLGLLILAPIPAVILYRGLRNKDALGPAALVLVGFATWWAMFHREAIPAAAAAATEKKPDILLIASDSLRPDRLGCYGNAKRLTPNIDRLCAEGTVFEEAYVPMPRTFPSWASILSGQPPWIHGIRNMFPDPKTAALPEDLPRWLAKEGYASAVFSDYAGDIFPRFDAGFDKIDAPPFNFRTLIETDLVSEQKFLMPFIDSPLGRRLYPLLRANADAIDGSYLTEKVAGYLSQKTRSPRFTAVFYSTTHFPFGVSYPDIGKFTDPTYDGPFYFKKPPISDKPVTDADRRQIQDIYDECVFAADREIGRLVDAVRKGHGGADTVIILTSDHGENLYEIDEDLGHGDHFRSNRTLQVPLILSAPNRVPKGLRVPGLASSMDIAPTLAAFGQARVPEGLEGHDLAAMIRGEPSSHGTLFFETGEWFVEVMKGYLEPRRIPYPDITTTGEIDYAGDTSISIKPEYYDITNIAKHRMVFDGRYKLLYMPTPRGIKWELYDLLYDPDEKDDLSAENPELVRTLARALARELGAAPNTEVRRNFFLPLTAAK